MKNKFGFLFAASAMVSLPAAQIHAQAQEPCLTQGDAEAVMVAIAPTALTTAIDTCSPELPGEAALSNAQQRIADVFEPAADRAWPRAGRALLGLQQFDLPDGFDPDALRPFLGSLIGSLIQQEIKPADCQTINEFYTALEPLPPENLAKFTVALIALGTKDDEPDSDSPFRICQ